MIFPGRFAPHQAFLIRRHAIPIAIGEEMRGAWDARVQTRKAFSTFFYPPAFGGFLAAMLPPLFVAVTT